MQKGEMIKVWVGTLHCWFTSSHSECWCLWEQEKTGQAFPGVTYLRKLFLMAVSQSVSVEASTAPLTINGIILQKSNSGFSKKHIQLTNNVTVVVIPLRNISVSVVCAPFSFLRAMWQSKYVWTMTVCTLIKCSCKRLSFYSADQWLWTLSTFSLKIKPNCQHDALRRRAMD